MSVSARVRVQIMGVSTNYHYLSSHIHVCQIHVQGWGVTCLISELIFCVIAITSACLQFKLKWHRTDSQMVKEREREREKSDRGCRKQKERKKVGGRWRLEGKKRKRKRRADEITPAGLLALASRSRAV